MSESIYYNRMNRCYPQVISSILEFQAIINSEYPEFDALGESRDKVLSNAYLLTMDEDRIVMWEQMLNIVPIAGSSVDDRRETIIARIRGQGKLNSATINAIVNSFTGGTAKSWVKDGVLYVEITPPRDNKQYQFANVEQELKNKVPAHLGFKVDRNYLTWGELFEQYSTWQDIKDNFDTWDDVYLFVPFE